jgi:hypothetical protein
MIVRDVTNTRPPEVIAAWLDGLGEFEQIEPAAAAERWGVSIRDAMERLHAMCGGPLEIPAGADRAVSACRVDGHGISAKQGQSAAHRGGQAASAGAGAEARRDAGRADAAVVAQRRRHDENHSVAYCA